ncbi:MAG: CsbD family protein [Phormidesmis sp.]
MVKFDQYRRLLKRLAVRTVCAAMVAVAVWGGAWMPNAIAVGSQAAADVVNERAAAEVDRMAGAGTSDQLEGAAQKTVGKMKRGLGEVTGQADDSLSGKLDSAGQKIEGRTDELKGKVKRDVGRTKGAAAEAGDDIEDTAGGVMESIKDFFN